MQKKQKIDEKAVDYIRKNKEALALRYPGLFLIFQGQKIRGKFKTNALALEYAQKNKLVVFVVWHFDPLPDRVAEKVLYDEQEAKRERERELNRLRQRRYYEKNREKVLRQQAERRKKNPEKNRSAVKDWYYRDKKHTRTIKKMQKMRAVA